MPVGPDTGKSEIEGGDTTVKVAVAAAEPLLALTVLAPIFEEVGTANVALKAPEEVVVTEAGKVVTEVPLKVTTTCELVG